MDYDTLYDLFTEEQLDGYDGEMRLDIEFDSIHIYEDNKKTCPHNHRYIARIWEVDSEEEGRTIYIFECGDWQAQSAWEHIILDFRYTMSDAFEAALEVFDGWYRTFEKADLIINFYSMEEFKEFESLFDKKLTYCQTSR